MKTVSVVVPTYNERDNIQPLVERLDGVLSGNSYEIVIIDDNSRDGTAEIARELSARYPVRVIVRKNERGLATAVIEGFRQARGDTIAVMDADLQHPPEIVLGLFQAIQNGADIAVASRYVPGGGCEGWTLSRKVMSRGAGLLAHMFLPTTRKIHDPMSGFFMFDRKILDGTILRPKGYKILLELLAEGNFDRVAEVPFMFQDRSAGKSKLGARTQLDYLQHIYSLMKRKGELARFIKFLAVGGSGVLVNFGVFALFNTIVLAGVPGAWRSVLASIVSAETSIISNFTLNDFLTFSDRRRGTSFLTRLFKFNAVSIAGIGIQALCVGIFNGLMGINEYIALAIGITLAMSWNYLANSLWTWNI